MTSLCSRQRVGERSNSGSGTDLVAVMLYTRVGAQARSTCEQFPPEEAMPGPPQPSPTLLLIHGTSSGRVR